MDKCAHTMKPISASQTAASDMFTNGEVRAEILDKPDSEGKVYGSIWFVLDEVIVPKLKYGSVIKGLE